jgi:excisionase family DNA binding protein
VKEGAFSEVRASLTQSDVDASVTAAITPREIAALERLSPDAIYRAIASGDLPARKVCGRLRVDRSDYEDWKQRHRVRPRPVGPMFGSGSDPARRRVGTGFLAELHQVEQRAGHGA